jgi:hypothetical protein
VLYLTNFTGSAGIVVLTGDRLTFVTDSRYVTAVQSTRGAADECVGLELEIVEGSYDATLAGLLERLPGERVGFEAGNLTVARHRWLSTALGAQRAAGLVPTEGIVERGRVRKDSYEIATLREAARRLSSVAAGVITEVRAGRTEQEVAQALIVLSPDGNVPPELAGTATVIEWPLPDRAEIAKILDDAIAGRPGPKPYAPDPKFEQAKAKEATVMLSGIESVEADKSASVAKNSDEREPAEPEPEHAPDLVGQEARDDEHQQRVGVAKKAAEPIAHARSRHQCAP